MEALLESWSDYVVDSEEYTLPTLIGPKLYKAGKAAKNKSVNEEKETADSKVDNLEEYQASITSIKKTIKKLTHLVTP